MSIFRRRAWVLLLIALPAHRNLAFSLARGNRLQSREVDEKDLRAGVQESGSSAGACAPCANSVVREGATGPESWGELLDRYAYVFQVPVSVLFMLERCHWGG